MSLRGITLHLNSTQLSDLFFNYEHPERDKLYVGDENTPINEAELDMALTKDALDFCTIVGQDGNVELAHDLVQDFKKRV